MGASWHDPNAEQFRSRGIIFGELMTPVPLNRYTYDFANPLVFWDPDGRFATAGRPLLDGVWRSATAFERQAATDKRTAKLRAERKLAEGTAAYEAASSAARKDIGVSWAARFDKCKAMRPSLVWYRPRKEHSWS
jgi:hypothetical protein